jgi:DNA polymerase V
MSAYGGKRPNAGRPKGLSKYGEPTIPMRIPVSKKAQILYLLNHSNQRLPLYTSKVRAGALTPSDDFIEDYIDLSEALVKHPHATFLVIASGDSMIGAGIESGDMLIVDKEKEATHGKIVIAAINGELTVKRLYLDKEKAQLRPENDLYSPIDITSEQQVIILGVVTHIIHQTD